MAYPLHGPIVSDPTADVLPMDVGSPAAVALARVAYEGTSGVCAHVAEELRSLLGALHPALPGRVGIEPVRFTTDADATTRRAGEVASNVPILRPWFETLAPSTRALAPLTFGEDVWLEVEPLPGPSDLLGLEAVLVLPVERLTDNGDRRALSAAIAGASDFVTRILLVFLDATGSGLPYGTDEATVRGWAGELLVGERHVLALLAGVRTERGLPVSADAVAEAVAVSLAAELVSTRTGLRRAISGGPEGRSGIFAFGARAVRFDAGRLAARLAPRLAADMLEETVFGSRAQALHDLRVPRAASDVLRDLKMSGEAAPTLLVHQNCDDAGDAPVLVGQGFFATAETGALAESLSLDSAPMRHWPQAVYEYDRVLRRARLPRWLDGMRSLVTGACSAETARVEAAAASAFAMPGSATELMAMLDAIDDRIREQYEEVEVLPSAVVPAGGGTSSSDGLSPDIENLRTALDAVPHRTSVLLRGGLLVALQALVGVPLLLGTTTLQQGLGLLVIVLALATVAATLDAVRRGGSRAEGARDRALLAAQRRCAQSLLCAAVEGLRQVAVRLHGRVAAVRAAARAVLGELERLRQPAPSVAQERSETVLHLPRPRDDAEAYTALCAGLTALRSQQAQADFLAALRGAFIEAIEGARAPATVGGTTRTWALERCRRAVASQMLLLTTLQPAEAGRNRSADLESVLQHLFDPAIGSYFVCAPLISELLDSAAPTGGETVLVAPEWFEGKSPAEHVLIAAGDDDWIVAMHLLEIGQ